MSLDNNNGGSMVSAILGDLDKPAAPVNHNTDTAIDESQDLLLVANEDEVEIDDSFSLDGFQVVRREFFAHTFEPSISMQDNKIGFNTAAIRKMPDTDYVQFLINSDSRTLVIMPCAENAPDSLMWCSTSKGKRKPRHVSGRFFFLKLAALMEWNPDNRYKILGKLIRSNGQNLFVFKLDDVEQYKREKVSGKATRRFPERLRERRVIRPIGRISSVYLTKSTRLRFRSIFSMALRLWVLRKKLRKRLSVTVISSPSKMVQVLCLPH